MLWKKCSHTLASLKTASLPSRRRFHARLARLALPLTLTLTLTLTRANLTLTRLGLTLTLTHTLTSCNATMAPCVGPAEAGYKTLLAQAASDGQVEYGEQFYSRLSHMLVLVCA